MIWLASYPRSGNTFFRIVLSEVYGIESSEYHREPGLPFDKGYFNYPVVKTHLLPSELKPTDPSIPAVYLVRDGRDSIVSLAHHRSDIVAPGSSYRVNVEIAVKAAEGTFFGGWSRHATEWLKRAQVVIRFEDLIRDPIGQVERIRPFLDMPEPDRSKLPTFADLKERDYIAMSPGAKREKFFRRGQVGAWQDEMPFSMQMLFWQLHGEAMRELGYTDGLARTKLLAPGFVALRSIKRLFTGFYFSQKSAL